MTGHRYLIVNADDFGQSGAVNRGIVKAYKGGVVTSTSLMVRWPKAAEAASLQKECPRLSIGLHLDFGEWALQGEEWVPLYQVVPLDNEATVADEVNRQLEVFRALVGRNPTHLDSHQHVHQHQPVKDIVLAVAEELGTPLRHYSKARYCGNFYGQDAEGRSMPGALTVDALIRILTNLPAGYTELACHPADGDDLATMYRLERMEELQTLCDPRLRATIDTLGIHLVPHGQRA